MYDQKLYDKIVARIRKDENGCWLWTGPYYKNRPWPQNRYGYIGFWYDSRKGRSRSTGTHRAMMMALHGPLTKEQCVCHRCDVPLCVNPEHLFIGSMRDNIHDSRSKNRHHEGKKEYCDRGHPLSGDNLYLSKQARGKGPALRRVCRVCQKARYRMKLGWPEHLAYDMSIRVPHGYKIDRVTGEFVSPRRQPVSADAEQK